MPSLNWILVLALAYLHYLAARPSKRNQLQDVIMKLNNLHCKEEDSTFYSPSLQTDCIASELECTMNELIRTAHECFGNDTGRQNALKASYLINQTLINNPQLTTEKATKCTQCELQDGKPYKEFIGALEKLIQNLNSNW